jgi:hypothetical protein
MSGSGSESVESLYEDVEEGKEGVEEDGEVFTEEDLEVSTGRRVTRSLSSIPEGATESDTFRAVGLESIKATKKRTQLSSSC